LNENGARYLWISSEKTPFNMRKFIEGIERKRANLVFKHFTLNNSDGLYDLQFGYPVFKPIKRGSEDRIFSFLGRT